MAVSSEDKNVEQKRSKCLEREGVGLLRKNQGNVPGNQLEAVPPEEGPPVGGGFLATLALGAQQIYSSSSEPTTASCLSWYSVMRSRTFLSASWNSISSIPSPLYQWRNALRLYMAPNWVARRWKMPLSAVVLATKVQLCWVSLGGTATTEVFMLLGIHSTKSSELADWRFSTFSSTSCVDIFPRNKREAVMYLPSSGLTLEKKLRGEKHWLVSSWTLTSW